MKKLGLFGLVLVLVIGMGYVVFDRLGGNNPIEITFLEKSPETLIGKTFRGTPQDKGLEDIFKSVETQKNLHPGSKIHTIYFIEPAGKLDTMEVFVGINIPFPVQEFESKIFRENKYLLATIRANKWVMPGPNKVKERLYQYGKENNLELTGIFIDKIISEKEVQVMAPIK
jgi:hypothetical protein